MSNPEIPSEDLFHAGLAHQIEQHPESWESRLEEVQRNMQEGGQIDLGSLGKSLAAREKLTDAFETAYKEDINPSTTDANATDMAIKLTQITDALIEYGLTDPERFERRKREVFDWDGNTSST